MLRIAHSHQNNNICTAQRRSNKHYAASLPLPSVPTPKFLPLASSPTQSKQTTHTHHQHTRPANLRIPSRHYSALLYSAVFCPSFNFVSDIHPFHYSSHPKHFRNLNIHSKFYVMRLTKLILHFHQSYVGPASLKLSLSSFVFHLFYIVLAMHPLHYFIRFSVTICLLSTLFEHKVASFSLNLLFIFSISEVALAILCMSKTILSQVLSLWER